MEETLRLAKLLGKHIQETAAYGQMKAAQTEADADEELQKQIGEFNLKRMNLSQLMNAETQEADGKEKIEALNEEIKALYGQIMLNPHMQVYSEAQGAVSEMLQKVNTILTAAANGTDPDTVDTEVSCSGDCGSCGGCH